MASSSAASAAASSGGAAEESDPFSAEGLCDPCYDLWTCGVPWIDVLLHLEPMVWWHMRWLSRSALEFMGEPLDTATSAEAAAMWEERGGVANNTIKHLVRLWPLDATHMHGGLTGILLAKAVRGMIHKGDGAALRVVCDELRRRGASAVPWTLSSRELFLYASGQSSSAKPVKVILSMSPKVIEARSSGRGYTALQEAVFCRKVHNVEALLQAEAETRDTNNIGETALHTACFVICEASADIAEMLLTMDETLYEVPDDQGRLPVDRFWEAEAKWQRKEKTMASEERTAAALRLWLSVDPTGRSIQRDERVQLLELLGLTLEELQERGLYVQPQPPPSSRRPRQRRRGNRRGPGPATGSSGGVGPDAVVVAA